MRLRGGDIDRVHRELGVFETFGRPTVITNTTVELENNSDIVVPTYTNEFWTSRQRAAHSLHEISYRACFKPQLPRFFIERLTKKDDLVYDPFMGRGTTILEAALLGRRVIGNDINPLSRVLVEPRLSPPSAIQVKKRIDEIDLTRANELREDLMVFYHPDTLVEICALREYLLERANYLDDTDKWIQMVALNRLTGHSPGFFSVYTLPPNQAVSVESQKKINETRRQTPPRRNVKEIILKKTRTLLADLDPAMRDKLGRIRASAKFTCEDSEATLEIESSSVDLAITSPPFLDIVNYAADNWLRCWFIGINANRVNLSIIPKVEDWQRKMTRVFFELHRVLKPEGFVAFEVGEVRNGKVLLEEIVIRAARQAAFDAELILINSQTFTKTANAWGVSNNSKGTNTNRIVLLKKAD
ncbi:MAG: site-specific DNA-methyltransferase [Anaerolineae bacterium]|nr:site-specific DNA-methyltransferase [Anaerolineae bacterium]